MTNEMIRTSILSSIHTLHTQIADDIARIDHRDFSDDDTDYFPARASMLTMLITMMMNEHHTDLTTQLDDLLAITDPDDDRAMTMTTIDIDLPFLDLFPDDFFESLES